ncbi:DNA polymerase III subunit delta [Novosphingobium huizhouense]|uniref:DNA polymerase III subunit delta n=1 Tax=Novosphingobium huizhouense TaxID=2866625 RepID=UPI001CD8278F|nr:DNA polymerase III subunit delta [Novosphingobium huizhouense]
MKATQKNFAGLAQKAARDCRLFYFCGPDEAGASDAAAKIASLLPAGEKVELAGSDLRRDPVRLADEARSTSLFGDRRQIHVRSAGDEVHDAVETLLASPVDGWPVLIVATSATDKSRVAKLLADRGDALVVMFHPPELRSIAGAVRDWADTAGVRLNSELAERIARSTALDTRMARSEIEKLALYLDASPQAPRSADAAALDAVCAQSEDDGMSSLVNAVLGGNTARLAGELARFAEQEMNPVGLLLAFERRCAQLAALAGRLGNRSDTVAFVEEETAARRIFFRDKADILVQLKRWRGARLERLVARLAGLHAALLADSRNAPLILTQGLTEIARAAAR